MNYKALLLIVLFSTSLIASSLNTSSAQVGEDKSCEQCGMLVDSVSQAHYRIIDSNGNLHYAECMMCALKLLKVYGQLNITTYCDYYGPSYPITVIARQNGSSVTVTPSNALVIAGGGCTKNRVVYNQTAASALLANNGISNYLAAIQKYANGVSGTLVSVFLNATISTMAQAALQFGGGLTSPSPTPTPTPTPAAQTCEQCGMTVAADMQAHLRIVDGTGATHYACCIKCAIKILTRVSALNITTNCDWYGSNFPITISVKNNLSSVTVTPSTALLIDGSCANNRVVYDLTAANALLANNGSSRYLCTSQNTTISSNATVMSLAQAVTMYGSSPTPSPSPSPTPTATPVATPTPSLTSTATPSSIPTNSNSPTPTQTANPTEPPITETPLTSPSETNQPTSSPHETATTTATPTGVPVQQCEVCGMDVSADAQARYVITDGNGNVHYVECFMCALQLLKDYPTLHMQTYCDWYGPSYPITVDSTNYGQDVVVTPSTAMFLRGGSCVTARAAYNQTAADNLLTNGYSQYTSPEQQYALPSTTQVKTVNDAIDAWYVQPKATTTPTNLILALAVVAGVVVVVMSFVAYKKIKR
jgi:hypothetical protein